MLPLIELMRDAWFKDTRAPDDLIFKNGLPISIYFYFIYYYFKYFYKKMFDSAYVSTAHVDEDYKEVKWPSAEIDYATALIRMLIRGNSSLYPLPNLKLQMEDMLQHIQLFTRTSHTGSNSFYEPLARLIDALNNEANLKSIDTLLLYVNGNI